MGWKKYAMLKLSIKFKKNLEIKTETVKELIKTCEEIHFLMTKPVPVNRWILLSIHSNNYDL